MEISAALVVFSKQPDPQGTKTRLTPPFNRQEAASLYACFLADTLAVARQVEGVDRYLAYDPPASEAYFAQLAPDFLRIQQAGDDLGERMGQAMAGLFSQGYRQVVLIGSDLPHLSPETIDQGFDFLRHGAEAVLGPSADGGYYLVALDRPAPEIFDLPMSTPVVLQQTLVRICRLDLRLAMLPETFDIDTAADLTRLQALLEVDPAIPALHTRLWLAKRPARF